ncbi:uncharacterized protein STEHIDRAFT_170767 [Stereum hirsutum FP-91666 SS1]|uniref:uncharacterized protein n=1 Tax=Stereum hirsutum (strain FP-91666) TaxID=721885 RepID=UPI00044499B9|nr:uncharacterized protein STEHIDRAFT_170767 [Stereum hirsutum FP-91666 SS1]EIM83506.1 hypothetical protein STEHIDRAFT_170767 [Stereum hirsutum FP-91666 SS1]
MSGSISIAVGIVVGLIASCVQSLGMTVQRKSHLLNQALPEELQKADYRRPLWLLGFAIFFFSNILGSIFQIASLPVVILAPLGAVSLLWNAFFARLLLGDVFSPWMLIGTILIAGGAVMIGYFGIVPEPNHSLDDLLALFNRPAFIAYFSLLGLAVVICLVITHIAEFSYYRHLRALAITAPPSPLLVSTSSMNEMTTERTPLLDRKPPSSSAASIISANGVIIPASRTPLFLSISYSSASGLLSGMCLLFAKSGVELLLLTIGGDNQFVRWQTWMLLLGLVAFALLQLWYLHKALKLANPTIVCPLAFCFYNLSSIVNGLVYFDQVSLLPTSHLLLVILGIAILLGGVWVVSFHAGPGVDVGSWNEEDEEDALGLDVEGGSPMGILDSLIVEEPLSDDLEDLRTPTYADNITDYGTGTDGAGTGTGRGRGKPLRPLAIDRQTASESQVHPPHSPTQSPTSPTTGGTVPSRSMLSPTRSRRRRTSVMSPGTEHGTLAPPPAPGFSIGLSPVSPGFTLMPRERRKRVVSGSSGGMGTGLGISSTNGAGTIGGGSEFVHGRGRVGRGEESGHEGEAPRMRRTVSEGDVNGREAGEGEGRDGVDVERGGEGGEGETDGLLQGERGQRRGKKGMWGWLRGAVRRE